MKWMYQKRITGLLKTGLISVDNKQICLTNKGEKMAKKFAFLRNLMVLEN